MAARYTDLCVNGHDLRLPNAFAGSDTSRRCRQCRNSYNKRWASTHAEHLAAYNATYVRPPESLERTVASARTLRHIRRYDGIVYLGGVCLDCGYKQHLDALQFDHIPERGTPDRKAILGMFGWDRMQEELDKCELVCANCHAIRTAARGQRAGVQIYG